MELELPRGFELAAMQASLQGFTGLMQTGGDFTTSDGLLTFSYNKDDENWYQTMRGREPARVVSPIPFGYYILKTVAEIGINAKKKGIVAGLDKVLDFAKSIMDGNELTDEQLDELEKTLAETDRKSGLSSQLPPLPEDLNLPDDFKYAMGAQHPDMIPVDPQNPPIVVLERILEGIDARLAGNPLPEYCIEYGEVPPREVLEQTREDIKAKIAAKKAEIKWSAPDGFNPEHN